MRLVITIAVILLLVSILTTVDARAVRKSCGKYLADRISDLCKAHGGYTQLTNAFQRQSTESHQRVKRGVVEECCKQSCSDVALMRYCMDQVEEPDEQLVLLDEAEPTSPKPTEKPVELTTTTRFPYHPVKPIEIGTVRPEFNNINAKMVINRRKQYHYSY